MIDLYACGSPNVSKVLLMLSELELPYRLHVVDVSKGEQFSPEFTALNPNQKVPVIVDSDGPDGVPVTVFESGAILMYLAEKTGRFWPATMTERYRVIEWLMFQMANIGPMCGQATHYLMYAPPGNEYSQQRYLSQVRRLYDVMEGQLAKQAYLAGDDYSLADIATYPWAGRLYNIYQVPMDQYPAVSRWKDAIKERPAFERIRTLINDLNNSDRQKLLASGSDDLDRFMVRGKYARA